MSEIKSPPHSIEAEQAVLGGLMLDNGRWTMLPNALLLMTSIPAHIARFL